MKNNIETMKYNQSDRKNDISEVKNTLEGIISRLDIAKNWISELEDKIETNHSIRAAKVNRIKKQEDGF